MNVALCNLAHVQTFFHLFKMLTFSFTEKRQAATNCVGEYSGLDNIL